MLKSNPLKQRGNIYIKNINMKKVIRLNENDIEKLVKKIINEDKGKTLKKACWKGYEAIGMKEKNGKEVPNCVPIKENDEGHESKNYMFWQNLKTIHHASGELLEMNQQQIDDMCANGHAWAVDHISSSADDVEEVYHFFESNIGEYDGEEESQTESYLPNLRGKKVYEDFYGSVEVLPLRESEYKGRKVTLNKPFYTPDGPKKSSVYVKNAKGNVVKVNFGDPNMEIKKDNPERRKSFRARHKCSEKKNKTTPGYWSCKAW